jgi:hypothetical protein
MNATERSEPEAAPAAAEREETVLLEWTVHLLRRDPRRAQVVFGAMTFAALAGLMLFRSPLFAVVGAAVIFLSTAEYLLPIRYRLTTLRACAACGVNRLEIRWESVRRLLGGRSAVKLSPLAADSRLEPFRGVLLRFAPEGEPGDRESVLRIIRERAVCAKESDLHPSEGERRNG